MSEFSLVSNKSKVFYGCLRQGYKVLSKIQSYKTFAIGELFPNVATQWGNIKQVLELGVSKQIAWTGMSMTKSDNVPDETRVPPIAVISSSTIRMMHAKAAQLGVTLSGNYIFFDEDNELQEALATWFSAVNAYLEIKNMMLELMQYKSVAAGLVGETDVLQRSAAQLMIFDASEAPLLSTTARWCNIFSASGMQSGFGTFHDHFLYQTCEQLAAATLPTLNATQIAQTANKQDHPRYPGVRTIYNFSMAAPHYLVGILRAQRSDGGYINTAYYTDDRNGYVELSMPVADAPASVTAELFGLMGA